MKLNDICKQWVDEIFYFNVHPRNANEYMYGQKCCTVVASDLNGRTAREKKNSA